ncbi:hypothetical protein EYZ11_012670 [Aspergillus tanneri]|uniref:Uncharacterized protein n=1 Tax=Aspergillus tanneri TaxID=1220188 RepID=A0A4V3UMM8_9EURO|nr:hypothetical protein EYZ11_012670 [Aspergillus tanneri]
MPDTALPRLQVAGFEEDGDKDDKDNNNNNSNYNSSGSK